MTFQEVNVNVLLYYQSVKNTGARSRHKPGKVSQYTSPESGRQSILFQVAVCRNVKGNFRECAPEQLEDVR